MQKRTSSHKYIEPPTWLGMPTAKTSKYSRLRNDPNCSNEALFIQEKYQKRTIEEKRASRRRKAQKYRNRKKLKELKVDFQRREGHPQCECHLFNIKDQNTTSYCCQWKVNNYLMTCKEEQDICEATGRVEHRISRKEHLRLKALYEKEGGHFIIRDGSFFFI